MTFDRLLQKKMFLLVIILLIIYINLDGIQTGYNRTLAWQYDFRFWIFRTKPFLWLAFLIGYGILALLKCWTNKNTSILHLIFMSLTLILEVIVNFDLLLAFPVMFVSTIIFIMNFLWAIKNRNIKFIK